MAVVRTRVVMEVDAVDGGVFEVVVTAEDDVGDSPPVKMVEVEPENRRALAQEVLARIATSLK